MKTGEMHALMMHFARLISNCVYHNIIFELY